MQLQENLQKRVVSEIQLRNKVWFVTEQNSFIACKHAVIRRLWFKGLLRKDFFYMQTLQTSAGLVLLYMYCRGSYASVNNASSCKLINVSLLSAFTNPHGTFTNYYLIINHCFGYSVAGSPSQGPDHQLSK